MCKLLKYINFHSFIYNIQADSRIYLCSLWHNQILRVCDDACFTATQLLPF